MFHFFFQKFSKLLELIFLNVRNVFLESSRNFLQDSEMFKYFWVIPDFSRIFEFSFEIIQEYCGILFYNNIAYSRLF